MSCLFLSSPLVSLTLTLRCASHHHLQRRFIYSNHHLSIGQCLFPSNSRHSLSNHKPSITAVTPSSEGAISVLNFEDFADKDWSFLETDNSNTSGPNYSKTEKIISSGQIEGTSKVLVSIGSEGFVDQIVQSSPCQQLVVVHDSLLTLACIKEKCDNVNCWQGELIELPEKWPSFDVMFLYFLPALPFELDQILGSLAKRCLPGTRVIISLSEGREVLEQQRQQHPDVIISDLPDKLTLEKAAADHSFEMIEFIDEPGFYLAVLKFETKS